MRFALAALLIVFALPASAAPADWTVIEVHDGDTIYVEVPELPKSLRRVGLRLAGIDAPEIGGRARCAAERALAERARDFVRRQLAGANIVITPIGWDKYGGRIDAVILTDGRSLADQLVGAGLARRYDGAGKRPDWCG